MKYGKMQDVLRNVRL